MRLVTADAISRIDNYAEQVLNVPRIELMRRSGEAIADTVKSVISDAPGATVTILCGSGNNGGDGYAAASMLLTLCDVTVVDVFSSGQRTSEGRYYLEKCLEMGIRVEKYDDIRCEAFIKESNVIVDCIFGTGIKPPYPDRAMRIAELIAASCAKKIAVDVPLGVNPTTGETLDITPMFDITVELSFGKCGIYSYPAKEYAGKILLYDIGIPRLIPNEICGSEYELVDKELANSLLPCRTENTNKGSFGRLLICAGSAKYKGAAHLALEAALRSGTGYVTMHAEEDMLAAMLGKFPEAIYAERKKYSALTDSDIDATLKLGEGSDAILIGPGCDRSEGLFRLVSALLSIEGSPIILDADAINVIADMGSLDTIRNAKRNVILTPHPGELSRLISQPVSRIQANRLRICRDISEKLGCTLVLKGAATVICGEGKTYINSTGSSALAKAGSGDCLAGLLGGILAQGTTSEVEAAALACYIHGIAGDELAKEFSRYGVTPSDLPKQMAREIKKLSENQSANK